MSTDGFDGRFTQGVDETWPIARYIRVYGYAEPPIERVGMLGPGHYIRIRPTLSWSWN